ncbi:MAG: hypothetical protein KKH92_03710 [Firmicutes bacterium]|nr:hypothetical protein [Bacillota bacterium]
MKKYITLIEGECEKSIIEWLKPKGYLFGQTRKVVLSEIKHISRSLYMINKQTIVTVLMDTDTIIRGESDRSRLKENIIWLIENSKRVRIITQDKNLEDELIRALNLSNIRQLIDHFNERSLDGLKSTLSTINPEKLENKFIQLNLDLFWSSKLLNQLYQDSNIIILNCTLKDIK